MYIVLVKMDGKTKVYMTWIYKKSPHLLQIVKVSSLRCHTIVDDTKTLPSLLSRSLLLDIIGM